MYLKKITSPLFKTSWHRVVLDEAHIIRNKDTRTAKAVFELSAIFKIFASGTPIFNSLGDLYPMCKFSLVAARTLHRLLIQPYFLHRKTNTILDGRKLLDIPAKIIKTHLLRFSEQEWEAYDDIQAKPSLDGNILYIPGSFPKSCGHVFVKWLRWRQCCVHPYLTQEIDDEDTQKTETPILKATNAVEIASENGSRCEICREIIMPGSEEVLPDLVCEKHCFCDLCLCAPSSFSLMFFDIEVPSSRS
ncbi:hypothetical protein K439DRAFT_1620909 [Ramaria rubella]|nr:hypothetical protein K439DRAFT_1620909 [Ramaria rubella]